MPPFHNNTLKSVSLGDGDDQDYKPSSDKETVSKSASMSTGAADDSNTMDYTVSKRKRESNTNVLNNGQHKANANANDNANKNTCTGQNDTNVTAKENHNPHATYKNSFESGNIQGLTHTTAVLQERLPSYLGPNFNTASPYGNADLGQKVQLKNVSDSSNGSHGFSYGEYDAIDHTFDEDMRIVIKEEADQYEDYVNDTDNYHYKDGENIDLYKFESDDSERRPTKVRKLNKDGAPRAERQPRAPLLNWNGNDDHWKMAVIGIVYECGQLGLDVPFDRVAKMVSENCTGSALQQAILKLRVKMTAEGYKIPPLKMTWPRKNKKPTPLKFVLAKKSTSTTDKESLIVIIKRAYQDADRMNLPAPYMFARKVANVMGQPMQVPVANPTQVTNNPAGNFQEQSATFHDTDSDMYFSTLYEQQRAFDGGVFAPEFDMLSDHPSVGQSSTDFGAYGTSLSDKMLGYFPGMGQSSTNSSGYGTHLFATAQSNATSGTYNMPEPDSMRNNFSGMGRSSTTSRGYAASGSDRTRNEYRGVSRSSLASNTSGVLNGRDYTTNPGTFMGGASSGSSFTDNPTGIVGNVPTSAKPSFKDLFTPTSSVEPRTPPMTTRRMQEINISLLDSALNPQGNREAIPCDLDEIANYGELGWPLNSGRDTPVDPSLDYLVDLQDPLEESFAAPYVEPREVAFLMENPFQG